MTEQPPKIVSANGESGWADLLGGDVTDTRTRTLIILVSPGCVFFSFFVLSFLLRSYFHPLLSLYVRELLYVFFMIVERGLGCFAGCRGVLRRSWNNSFPLFVLWEVFALLLRTRPVSFRVRLQFCRLFGNKPFRMLTTNYIFVLNYFQAEEKF